MLVKCKKIIISIVMLILVVFGGVFILLYSASKPDIKYTYDSDYNLQWYLHKPFDMGVDDFWNGYEAQEDKQLTVAIIDSCVDIYHEDLRQHIWTNNAEIADNGIDDDNNGYIDDYYGWNFDKNSQYVYCDDTMAEHGTHCAGVIAADHNGIGIMGILGNTNVKLMILPIYAGDKLDCNRLVEAIRYADTMGADICSVSSVFVEGKTVIEEAIEETDMYFVTAAGNFQSPYASGLNLAEYVLFPVCCVSDRIIAVSSIDENADFSQFANYGPTYVDIVAPGERIYSTLPNNSYGYRSGTSVAVPIVTAVVGAYYYCYTDNVEKAVQLLYDNCIQYDALSQKVAEGRVVTFVLKYNN